MGGKFAKIVVVDFEYEVAAGGLPAVLCMVAYLLDENLQLVRTIRKWRGEFGSTPPFDIGPHTLVVGYSFWAEATCFMTLGWKFPVYVFDQHTAYLAASNLLLPHDPDEMHKRPRKGLSDACRAYGVGGWENIDKPQMAKDIGEGRWRDHGKECVLTYCEEDVRASTELLRRQLRPHLRLPAADVERVLFWSDYSAKAVAQIQAQGMPIDMYLWDAIQDNKVAVVEALLKEFDPSHSTENPIYSPDGEWSYARFEQWLMNIGASAWPRLDSGRLDIDGDAFRLMYHIPGVADLHALRDSLRVVVTAKLPIGRDGRNRPSMFPFGTATGRNAHCKSLFNAHAGMRSFMYASPGKIMVYLDWRTQEVGVAAGLSGDQALIEAYRSGDVYHRLALNAGITTDLDPKHWAKHNTIERQRMKSLQLGVNYGMGVPSLAKGLNRHPLVASHLIEMYRRKYEVFWEWRNNQALQAKLDRRIETVFGWPLHISTSPNQRTLFNFPMQGGGGEMLRLASVRLCEAGVVPCMLVHDGILFEFDNREQIELAREIMRKAGQDTCNGLEIGADVDQLLENGAHFRDKRKTALRMWERMMETLQRVGAIRRSQPRVRPVRRAGGLLLKLAGLFTRTQRNQEVGMKKMTSHGLEKFMSKSARGEPEAPPPRRVKTINPKYSRKVVLPWSWIERLQGASGQTYALALCVRHNDWKRSFGRWDLKPFNLTRNMVVEFEVSDRVKPVALRELEARGLVGVEWYNRKNPVLTWVLDTSATK